jgi:hypothetical protein
MDARESLLARVRAFCFPGGEPAARPVRGVREKQRGEMRSGPGARWIPFTAEEVIEATRSSFRWEARYSSGLNSAFTVTDAYEEGHGRLALKLGGLLPVKSMRGPEFDKGEIQRYLGAIAMCPAAILNHGSLEWSVAGPACLRVWDREDPTGATVDLEIGEDGRILGCRAERPRLLGKETVPTPWSAQCLEFRVWDGLRIVSRLEVSWDPPEGSFTYFRVELTEVEVLR